MDTTFPTATQAVLESLHDRERSYIELYVDPQCPASHDLVHGAVDETPTQSSFDACLQDRDVLKIPRRKCLHQYS